MSISEQVKELRIAAVYKEHSMRELLEKAADTIESLSEKLQAANMERSAEDFGKSVLKIETPKVCIDCPCHFAGESGMVMCGVEKRELLSDDIETFKPDWCPLRESADDCNGWIPCKEGLPENDTCVLAQVNGKYKNITFENAFEFATYMKGEGWILEAYPDWYKPDVIAWCELPEQYHEP